MVDLRACLAQDIADFARRVLAGNGAPQEVAALPSLLMWHSGVNPPAKILKRSLEAGRMAALFRQILSGSMFFPVCCCLRVSTGSCAGCIPLGEMGV